MEPAAHPVHRQPFRGNRVHWAWGGVAGVTVLLAVLWNSGALPGLDWAPGLEPPDRHP
jgi:hypothetical protein